MATRALSNLTLKSAYVVPAGAPWLALFTTAPTDAGVITGEVTGGSYARVAATGAAWNAAVAGGTAPSTISNSGTLTFPAATGNWGTAPGVIAWGLLDASTAGNLLFWDYMGNFNWLPFSVSLASPGIITSPGHGYSNGDTVIISSEYGGTLPASFVSVATQTVAGVTTDTFNIAVNTASTGSGLVRKISPQQINTGVTASFAATTLTISQA